VHVISFNLTPQLGLAHHVVAKPLYSCLTTARLSSTNLQLPPLPLLKLDVIMAEIKIDSQLFQERLGHFLSAWKADKRSGDTVFGGASSVLILMGKTEESAQFQKNNAIHVRDQNTVVRRELR
jgi:hypothetical protein